MSFWKDNTASRQPPSPGTEAREPARFGVLSKPEAVAPTAPAAPSKPAAVPSPIAAPAGRADAGVPRKESLIGADIAIEGKIEGGGSVRIAGKFNGHVKVEGDLTIEAGAKLTGSVRAAKVVIAGELEGNVEEASHVDILETGAVIGDLKAGSLTVAAGARMRGQAEFGWADDKGSKAVKHTDGRERSANP